MIVNPDLTIPDYPEIFVIGDAAYSYNKDAWLAWSFIHVVYLISFASRLLIMTQWIFLYFFNDQRIRLITRPVREKEEPPYL